MDPLSQICQEVANACSLKEGSEGVRRILFKISSCESISVKGLAEQLLLPIPIISAVRRELEKRKILIRKNGISLSPEARERFMLSKHSSNPNILCPFCSGKGFAVNSSNIPSHLIDRFKNIADRRPIFDPSLDQSHGKHENSLLRASYILFHLGAVGRNIIFLGDDDLLSIACGLLMKEFYGNDHSTNISVIDIDKRFIEFIDRICLEEGIKAEIILADLRFPLSENLKGKFDFFVTDPPYTMSGLILFSSRGIESLSSDGARIGIVAFAPKPPIEQINVVSELVSMNLAPLTILQGFNEYKGGTVLANRSNLMILAVLKEAIPKITREFTGSLYTAEVNVRSIKIYKCAGCRTEYPVGAAEKYKTIRELKDIGCPVCGADIFKAY